MASEKTSGGIDPKALLARAAAFHHHGELARAEAQYLRALSIDPQHVPALFALACLYQETGRNSQAESAYRRVIALDPNHVPALNNLGALMLSAGNWDRAAELFGRVAALDDTLEPAHANLALALERQGRVEAGAEVLWRFLENHPEAIHLWRHLGLMRFQQGDLAAAAEAVWKALSLDPKMDGADRILFVLLQAALHQGLCSPGAPRRWTERLAELAPESPLSALLAYHLTEPEYENAADAWRELCRRLDEKAPSSCPRPAHRAEGAAGPGTGPWALLFNFGRSGTGFLHSLVDGHPRVATLPGIYFKDFFAQGSWRAVFDPDPRRMAARFCDAYAVLFDARLSKNVPGNNHPANFPIGVSEGFTAMGEDGRAHLTLDRPLFQKKLADLVVRLDRVEPLSFFKCVQAAFDAVLGRSTDPDLYFYHIHNPEPFALADFLNRAPDSRLLMIVRSPVQSLESWIAKSMDVPGAYPEIVGKVVRMLYGVDRAEYRLFPSAGVRLEDLKARPDETLAGLCRFLGIDPAPSLRTPTMQGLRWWGDPGSVRLAKADPFGRQSDSDPTERKVGALFSDTDQRVLETLFYPFSVRYGYADEDPDAFSRSLKRIRPLLERPFDFERRYAAAFPGANRALAENLHCAYLRRLLILRWETLAKHGGYPGTIQPI